MKIDDNYHIEKDDHSWNLIYTRSYITQTGKKKGEEVTSSKTWYYPNITTCLMGYVSQKVEPNNKTVEQVLAQLRDIKKTIENLLNKRI